MSRLPPPFGPFQPLRRLGAGGMAETFVAVRRGPGGFEQHVCIKRILPAFEGDLEFVESFLNEAKTSAALRHANIVQVLDFGVADGTHYLALELIEGLDLRALLGSDSEDRVMLDAELCTLIAADLCAALEHAHSEAPGRSAVVHRDVSPSNVLISSAGEVKLTDFGIARATGGRQRTATGIIKGKVPYMPPEYIEHGSFEPRGDLFSLGVLLYEVLGGVRPFDGHSDLDTIRRIVAGQRAHLGTLARGASPQLVQCIEALLAVRPEQRFGSARAVLDALPAIHTHRVRRRLGDLVRERLSARAAPPDPTANTLPRGEPLPSMTPAQYTPGPAALPRERTPATQPLTLTRDAPRLVEPDTRGGVRRPSTRPWWALGAAAALLTLVGALALWRALNEPTQLAVIAPTSVSSAAPQPELPEASVAASNNEGWAPASTPPTAPAPQVFQVHAGDPPPPPSEPVEIAPTAAQGHGSKRPKARPKPDVVSPAPVMPATPVAEAQAELKVTVFPYGDVWVDGKRLGQAPVTVKLAPGVHEVGVGDGRPREKRSITLAAGEKANLDISRKDVAESVE
jgi:serine/threonine protein kinase